MRVALILLAALMLSPPTAAQNRSDLTEDLDRFAAGFFDKLQPRSIKEAVEYCGLFIRDSAGRFAATKPRRGRAGSCQPEDGPAGAKVVASYHTHGAYDRGADTEVPSRDDLNSDIEEKIDGYIATPGGRLWLNDAAVKKSILLCGEGCVAADPAYRPCPAFPPDEEYTLESLKARAESDTGKC
jgi:hypothetical protein